MNLTIKLLRTLGSPFASEKTQPLVPSEILGLSDYSTKNRMLFYFLQRISRENLGELEPLYRKEYAKYAGTHDAIARVAQALENADVEYALIKTIRPYTSTTVDIDVLILGSDLEYHKAVVALLDSGYGMLGFGPQSTTLQDPKIDIKADIYSEIAVSHIIYLDKQKMAGSTVTKNLPNGKSVNILNPEADLLTVVAHSLIKEQMYTLSEYYTFVNYLEHVNLDKLIQLVKDNNAMVATRTHATITALLHKATFGFTPAKLKGLLEEIGEERLEAKSVTRNGLRMPHKYHQLTVARCLLEITKEEKSRKSVAMQLLRMLNPNFLRKFTEMFIDHLIRETY